MPDLNNLPMFFLGANAPDGFVSHFSDSYDPTDGWRAYIIKGGPGSGKSTLMKRVAKTMAEAGSDVVLTPCASDPQSLDGVIMADIKTVVLDGTSPHVVEPKYPGISEVILNMGECWNVESFAGKEKELLAVYKENKQLHERASRYITAAGSLLSDSYKIAEDCTDQMKATRFGINLAKKMIPAAKKSNFKNIQGKEWIRFLSGITPMGLVFYRSTLTKLCDNIVVISDDYGASSRLILSALRSTALELGWDVITCLCPFSPKEKIEHVIIPGLNLAFCTSNRYLQLEGTGERRIHARRFTDMTALRQKKQRLTFNRRASRELLEGAVELLSDAKKVHDNMEKYYIAAMDFDKAADIGDRVIESLLKRQKLFEI